MEKDLIDRLRSDTELAGLVGGHDRLGRPMIDLVERGSSTALPAIVIYKVSPGVSYDQDGRTGLEGPRYQFTVIGESLRDVVLAGRRLQSLLEGSGVTGETYFDRGFIDGERDLPVKDLEGGGREFGRAYDFLIWHRRAEP